MDSEMQIEGAHLTVHLPPELDHPNADRIREKTDAVIKKQYIKTITFDFQDTVFMDSSGIGLLMGRYKALGLRGGSIYAVHVNAHIFKILHLSGVYRFLEIQKEEPKSGESKEGRELWRTPMK